MKIIDGVEYLNHEEGVALLDRQARKYLGMSGEEFQRRYQENDFEGLEINPNDIIRISFLLPFARED